MIFKKNTLLTNLQNKRRENISSNLTRTPSLFNLKNIINMHLVTDRLVRLFRLYPDYFNYYLSHYYPFSKEEIEMYKSKLNWARLSNNIFLDWNEDLLLNFKDSWDWEGITFHTFGLKGLSYPFLIDKYVDAGLLIECLLSHNDNIEWSKERVFKYGFESFFYNSKINSLFKWDLNRVEEIMDSIKRRDTLFDDIEDEDLNSLVKYVDIEWDDDIIDKYIDEIDFSTRSNDFRTVNEGGYPWQYRYKIQVKTTPKEVESILCLLEKYGEKLIPTFKEEENEKQDEYYHRDYFLFNNRDYFLFNNPLKNGIEFTFNTEEKREALKEAVRLYYSDLHRVMTFYG